MRVPLVPATNPRRDAACRRQLALMPLDVLAKDLEATFGRQRRGVKDAVHPLPECQAKQSQLRMQPARVSEKKAAER